MEDWESALLEISTEIDDARDELDRLYEQRNELVAEALAEGVTQAEVARVLGVTHTAVQKMVRDSGPLTDTSP